jgi:hypothetical protein
VPFGDQSDEAQSHRVAFSLDYVLDIGGDAFEDRLKLREFGPVIDRHLLLLGPSKVSSAPLVN